jgi:hypothetical protein
MPQRTSVNVRKAQAVAAAIESAGWRRLYQDSCGAQLTSARATQSVHRTAFHVVDLPAPVVSRGKKRLMSIGSPSPGALCGCDTLTSRLETQRDAPPRNQSPNQTCDK